MAAISGAGSAEDAQSLSPALVTGGCGFIGYHIVAQILKDEPACQVHIEQILTQARPKTIFHVACPESTVQQPAKFKLVNVMGAHNLLVSAEKVQTVRAFINTSTSSVIHDNRSDLIQADESLPVLQYPAQKRVYTLTKAEAEAEILAANRAKGDASMLTVSMRPATIFGERDTITFGKIVANARKGNGKVQFGPGKNLYDFVYASNCADAHILAAKALLRAYGRPPPASDMRVDGESFNITNEEPIPVWYFQRAIAASVGLPVKTEEIKTIPVWVAYLMATIAEWVTWIRSFGRDQPIITREAVRLTVIERTLSGEKIKRVLGYKPKVTMDEGLARTGKWFVEQDETAEAKKAV
ncbi:NAD(P)-binding protein [Cryphonectria parasitica EP155]|uniref:NAD(P)-binding protein n=1 Tax=Cryphonectria parasitica (strain ATCC 38755 / EP155) TaxID=660469 RepID=A0A9P4Y6B8_CRYP1|nr:NAD(P)-binding protein [Cryphonectria parasitica EP155]KAF3767737.1 NAD(P)-binding protein [Cryphonectria parasitica EP155]